MINTRYRTKPAAAGACSTGHWRAAAHTSQHHRDATFPPSISSTLDWTTTNILNALLHAAVACALPNATRRVTLGIVVALLTSTLVEERDATRVRETRNASSRRSDAPSRLLRLRHWRAAARYAVSRIAWTYSYGGSSPPYQCWNMERNFNAYLLAHNRLTDAWMNRGVPGVSRSPLLPASPSCLSCQPATRPQPPPYPAWPRLFPPHPTPRRIIHTAHAAHALTAGA